MNLIVKIKNLVDDTSLQRLNPTHNNQSFYRQLLDNDDLREASE